MVYFVRAILFLVVVSVEAQAYVNFVSEKLPLGTHNSNMSVEHIGEAFTLLQERVGPNDIVTFLSCGCNNVTLEDSLKRAYPGRATRWSLCSREFSFDLALNRQSTKRTVVVVVALSEENTRCIRNILGNYLMAHNTEWFVFHRSQESMLISELTALGTRFSLCEDRSYFINRGDSDESRPPELGVSVFSRKCFLRNGTGRTRFTLPPEDKTITFANHTGNDVLDIPQQTGTISSYDIIYAALRAQNATLRFASYSSIHIAMLAIANSHADVLVSHKPNALEGFHITPILEYSGERFYTWMEPYNSRTFFFNVMIYSWPVFVLVLITILLPWLVLVSGNVFTLDQQYPYGDTALFLIASFFSTSAPVCGAWRVQASPRISSFRNLFLLVWMVAIMPLSVYFRGELTSRLSVTVEPNFLDTLKELETALDTNYLEPCFCTWHTVPNMIDKDGRPFHSAVLVKLVRAFSRRRRADRLLFGTIEDCFRCARRPGFACFVAGLSKCTRAHYKRDYIESRERLNIALKTMPARKDYPNAQVYSNLLRRLLETGLYPPHTELKTCGPDKVFADSTAEDGTKVHSAHIHQFFGFFACFCGLSLLSTVVFFLELALGRGKQREV